MGKNDLCITIPSFFRCPISLDVMTSPVSLSTGVTYDRASIQRWLEAGNSTCPATMQVLDDKDFVPNLTLRRLIQIWSHNNKFPTLSQVQVIELIDQVVSGSCSDESRLDGCIKILCFASESPENRMFLGLNEKFVGKLVDSIALEGPDLNPDLLEAILKLLEIILYPTNNNMPKNKFLSPTNPNLNLIPNLSKILKSERTDSRVAVARILEATAQDPESKKLVYDNHDILLEFFHILQRQTVEEYEIDAVLSCLVSLSSPKRNKIKLIKSGGVTIISIITDLLTKSENKTIIELGLTLLEMLVGCVEGRVAIRENSNCIPSIIAKIIKVSKVTDEHAIAILWSLCYLFRDQKARETMTKTNGGLTKILLLMQSDCSPAVKKMCCDLIRVFRVCSKSCLSSYDTKTTHIMPC